MTWRNWSPRPRWGKLLPQCATVATLMRSARAFLKRPVVGVIGNEVLAENRFPSQRVGEKISARWLRSPARCR